MHRSRGVTTLSSIHNQVQEPLVPARLRQAKEKTNIESKADERGLPLILFFISFNLVELFSAWVLI